MSRDQGGVGFAEVLAVSAILFVLALIAFPRLVVPTTIVLQVPARQLAADLRLAQRLAIARHVDYLLEMSPTTAPYTQYSVHASGGPVETDFPRTFDPGVSVSGRLQFQFRSDGTAVAGGSVTLTSGGSTAVVQVVAATGRVTVMGP
jgi:Tfp pilus assembly protein FimT